MRDFLTSYNLYDAYILNDVFSFNETTYTNPFDFIGETFEYHCEYENKSTLFELDLDEPIKKYLSALPAYGILDECYTNGRVDFTFKAIGKCKSCRTYNIYFLLRVYTTTESSQSKGKDPLKNSTFPAITLCLEKVGSYPKPQTTVNKAVLKHFDREAGTWYYKASALLSQGYGIGAFAYFRRIIERDLINIIQEIKKLPDSDAIGISKLINEYNKNSKNYVIYDNIFHLLPNSLKVLGENPIQMLYQQTSEGLHSLSEEECLERSKSILMLLDFTIMKIYEERSTLKDIKEAIKKLK